MRTAFAMVRETPVALKDSPIRQFIDDWLTIGLKDAQAAYRAVAGPILIPGVPREAADAGMIGTAADWMMRFLELVSERPSDHISAHAPDDAPAG